MTKRFGVRGVILFLFGFPWIIYGIGVLISKVDRFSRDGPGGPIEFMDNHNWGWFWIAVGIYGIASMFLRYRSEKWFDEYAYAFLSLPPAAWTISYAISALSHLIDPFNGRDTAYLGVAIFGNFLIMILYLARHVTQHEVR